MATVTIAEMQARIGEELVSDWIEVTQAMIDAFADATGDHQFIHVDPVRAAHTPFGGTVAHGFLTLSLIPQLAENVQDRPRLADIRMGVNYGSNRVRFLHPVRSGSKVRARFKLLSFDEKRPGQFQQADAITVEIDGVDTPALSAEWISQVFT